MNTILTAADRISAAVTGGEASSSSDLKELLNSYKELLMPEFVEEREAKVKKVHEIMKRENEVGSFQVEAMTYGPRSRKGLN